MNFLLYNEIAPQLSDAVNKGYRAGLAAVVRMNKKKILKLSDASTSLSIRKQFAEPLFQISYNKIDERILKNFNVEAFTVAGVLHYEAEEKLKAMAASILDGSHPLVKENPDIDRKKLWIAEAQNIFGQYTEIPDSSYEPSILNTNLRTATVSAYHGAQWQRLQELKDVYPAYQYKTVGDNRVRDEHAILADKIFQANDPIWNKIYPPNGWNCRCYVNALSSDELNDIKPDDRVPLTNIEEHDSLIKSASIPKEFQRNSGQAESIWGKWLQEKLSGKNYDVITHRMKEFVSAMPDADEAIKKIEANASAFRALEYTKENFEKEFPDNSVMTPLGEFEFRKNFFDKLDLKERTDLLGLVKPTMEQPDYIIVDARFGTLFVKAFNGDGNIIYAGVISDKDGLIVSFHNKENIKGKIKNGKLLIYQSEKMQPDANSSASFVELSSVVRRLNFAYNNVGKDSDTVNEIWGEFISIGKTRVRKIRYKVEGFEIAIDDGDFALKDYSEIDEYRKGVLMQ